MDLIELSKNNGFVSKDNLITVSDSYYYLWMCELQKWLREEHNISVCVGFRHTDTKIIEGINNVYYDVNIYEIEGGDAYKKIKLSEIRYDYEQALEKGLQEALKFLAETPDQSL